MASRGKVRLSGWFPEGVRVELYEREPGQLRPAAGSSLGSTVAVGGKVEFRQHSIVPGGKYFVVGVVRGFPVQVPVTASAVGDSAEPGVQGQAPVGRDRVRLADGRFVDELTVDSEEGVPRLEVAPAPKQEHARDVPQRSATPVGYAHPVDPEEVFPYPRQEDVPQMSDTETGMATPVVPTFSQVDVPAGTLQRSDTVAGVATPLPVGDAVRAQQDRESSESKAARGEPVKAAAQPVGVKKTSVGDARDGQPDELEPAEPALAPPAEAVEADRGDA
jgi:hypothetical protein